MVEKGNTVPSSIGHSTFKKFIISKTKGEPSESKPQLDKVSIKGSKAKSSNSESTKKKVSAVLEINQLAKISNKVNSKTKVSHSPKEPQKGKTVSSKSFDIAELGKKARENKTKKKVSSSGVDISDLAKISEGGNKRKKIGSSSKNIADLGKIKSDSSKADLGVGSGKLILTKGSFATNTSGKIRTSFGGGNVESKGGLKSGFGGAKIEPKGGLKSGFGGAKVKSKAELKTSFGGVKIESKSGLKSGFGGTMKKGQKNMVKQVGDIGEILNSTKSLMKNNRNHEVNILHDHLKEKLIQKSSGKVDLQKLSEVEKKSRESWYKATHEMTVEKRASKDSIQRRYNRAVKAREQAEAVIEESARKLYLAQEKTKKALESESKAKKEVEAILLDLNKAIAEANNSEQRRRALMITGITGIVLYLFTEFSLEPFVEAAVGKGIELVLAKIFLLFVLIPFQMITEKFMIKQTKADGGGIREHMFREILSVVIDDGVIDEKERNLIETFRRHNGLDPTRAEEIMSEYLAPREIRTS